MKLEELLTPELYGQVRAAIDKANEGQTDKTKHVRFADLSEGGYVSVDKFNSQVNSLTQQVKDLQGQITQRDTDIADLNTKLTAAQGDAAKLTEVQNQLTGLQSKYEADKTDWEAKTAKQQKEFTIREKSSGLKFSSAAARRDFLSQADNYDFGENFGAYDTFVAKYKADNEGAIIDPDPSGDNGGNGGGKPAIVQPTGKKSGGGENPFAFHFNGVRPSPKQ